MKKPPPLGDGDERERVTKVPRGACHMEGGGADQLWPSKKASSLGEKGGANEKMYTCHPHESPIGSMGP